MWQELTEVRPWSSPDAAGQKRIIRIWSAACVILVAAFYWPVILTGFRDIPSHDELLIAHATMPYGVLGAWHYFEPSFWTREIAADYAYYRPIALLSHAIDYRLWGLNPHPSHAVNIALHAMTVLLLGWLVALLAGNWLPGMLAGLLYAVLPTHDEPVSWIVGRMDILAGMFAVASMIALALAHRRRKWRLVAVSAFLFLLAVGSKETGGALAAVVVAWALVAARGSRRLPLAAAGVFVALGAGYLVFRYFAGTIIEPPQRHPFRQLGMRMHSYYLSRPLARLWEAVQLRSLGWLDAVGLQRGAVSAILLLGALPAALVMLTWRVAFYLPTLAFVQADDRYLYLPEMGSAALMALVVWRAALWLQRYREGLQWLPLAAYAWLFVTKAMMLHQALLAWRRF